MAVKTFADGDVLTAADCNDWFVPLVGYKSADTSRTGSTLTADPDLTIVLASGATYEITAVLFVKTSGSQNFEWGWNTPSGATDGQYYASYKGSGGSQVLEADLWIDASHIADCGAANNIQAVLIHGSIEAGSSGGDMALTWGTDASGTGSTSLTARSFLKAQRIA